MSSPCVLIVDDDEASLCQMSETVEGLGFAIRTATSGQGALDCLRGGNVDVLLLDLVMPDIDGLTVLVHLPVTGESISDSTHNVTHWGGRRRSTRSARCMAAFVPRWRFALARKAGRRASSMAAR